jgi:hypothetical protein
MSSAGLWAVDGNELYRWGQANARWMEGRGNGQDVYDGLKYFYYVQGVTELLQWQKIIELPENTIKQQVLDIVLKYLSDHPAERQYGGVSQVLNALSATYGAGRNSNKFSDMIK